MNTANIEDIQDLAGWTMSEKLDGVYAMRIGNRFISKNGIEFKVPAWFSAGRDQGTERGELWAGRGGFQRVLSAIRSGDFDGISFVPFHSLQRPAIAPEAFLAHVVAIGGEGIVLQSPTAVCFKVKPVSDCEARVVGRVFGKLSVECEMNGITFKVGTGIPLDAPEVGSVITIQHNGFTDSGIPRHARFVAVRDYE